MFVPAASMNGGNDDDPEEWLQELITSTGRHLAICFQTWSLLIVCMFTLPNQHDKIVYSAFGQASVSRFPNVSPDAQGGSETGSFSWETWSLYFFISPVQPYPRESFNKDIGDVDIGWMSWIMWRFLYQGHRGVLKQSNGMIRLTMPYQPNQIC